jgi:hypothetical protein
MKTFVADFADRIQINFLLGAAIHCDGQREYRDKQVKALDNWHDFSLKMGQSGGQSSLNAPLDAVKAFVSEDLLGS